MLAAPWVKPDRYAAFLARVREAEGVLYNYVSSPKFEEWPHDGYDCEGFARRANQRAGVLGHSAPDLRAAEWSYKCDPVPVGSQAPGDFGFYGTGGSISHIVLVVGAPDSSAGGHSRTMGANGGGSSTFKTDPNARVKYEKAGYWSSGFITYGRLKAECRYLQDSDLLILRRLESALAGGDPLTDDKLSGVVRRLYRPLLAKYGLQ